MKIKPISTNQIELSQDNKTYVVTIVDGLFRVASKEDKETLYREAKIMFREKMTMSIDNDLQEQIEHLKKVRGRKSRNTCTYKLESDNFLIDVKAIVNFKLKEDM